MRRHNLCACLLVLLAGVWLASPAAAQRRPRYEPPTEEQRARFARQRLIDARAFVQQDRLDAAQRTLLRGLFVSADDPKLHALLARVLSAQGNAEQAAIHHARADELAPPPPPVPREPLIEPATGLLIALVPPPLSGESPERVARDWPNGIAAQTLVARLQLRLPGADVVHADPQTVAEGRALIAKHAPASVLSLRVDRSYCGDTIKDGPFAVAWLRVAGELPGDASSGADTRRQVVLEPRAPGDCRAEALARGLERGFRHPVVRRAFEARANSDRARTGDAARWQNAAIRTLFPGIGERIKLALDRGRAQIAAGRIADARDTFESAAGIDPEDTVVRGYLAEVEATLAMARELELKDDPERFSEEDRGVLDPRYSPAQRAAAEARLAEARREREDLLAAQTALGEAEQTVGPDQLAALRQGEIHDPEAFGPRTARLRAGTEIEARVVYTPNGHEIARYYLPAGGGAAILREEDIDGNGQPDRWTAYRDGVRSELFEDVHAGGPPDVHFHFTADGARVERVEVDTDDDGGVDRTLRYTDSRLRTETVDTDGDGVVDRTDHFDADGYVETRDEDLDGDGVVDMRSTYEGGRLVERSIRELELSPETP